MARPPKSLLKDSHPHIAAQVVDQSLLPTLATGADRKIQFRCPDYGHIYEARPYNRTNAKSGGTGCPVCNGKQILIGFNDIATTQPQIAALFVDPEDGHKYTQKSNKKVPMRCPQGHEWIGKISNIVSQSLESGHLGCPYCAGRKSIKGQNDLATTHPDITAQLVDQTLAHTLKAGSNTKVKWQCQVDPNHVWATSPYDRITNGNNCPYCSNHKVQPGVTDIATTHPHLIPEIVNPNDAISYTAGSEVSIEWYCNNGFDHTYVTTIHNRTSEKSHCTVCNGKIVLPGFNDMATTNPTMAQRLLNPEEAIYHTRRSGKLLKWVCVEDKSHIWLESPCNESNNQSGMCPDCRPKAVSQNEILLANAIKMLIGEDNVQTSQRGILAEKRLELDIVAPNHNVAIEYNGLYWHSEVNKDRDYHALKTRLAKEAGLQLIHVWEDDFIKKPEIVIRSIAHKLNATHNLHKVFPNIDPLINERIGARKLTLTTLTSQEAKKFLEQNHIQGNVHATYHFALKDKNNNIRAILSTRRPEGAANRQNKPGQWEIQRYATCGIIPGAFTKLMKYAEQYIQNNGDTLNEWISFSSNDISNGQVYEKNGFILDSIRPPEYKYCGAYTKWQRLPKRQFQLNKFRNDPDLLWDESWTEHQAALANNLYRIYDSGKMRWIKPVR